MPNEAYGMQGGDGGLLGAVAPIASSLIGFPKIS